MTRGKLYSIWTSMVYRCHSESTNNHYAKYYRDAGVTVSDEWRKNFKAFETWSKENGYHEGMTIDRIDPYGDYSPENCRWLTKSEHARHGKRREYIPVVYRVPVPRVRRTKKTIKARALELLDRCMDRMTEEEQNGILMFLKGFTYYAEAVERQKQQKDKSA